MKRRFLIFTIVLLTLASASLAAAQTAKPVIGVSLPTITGVFYEALVKSAQTTADSLGATLLVKDAGGDVDVEAANIQALIDEGVTALLFTPVDPVASTAAVELANQANVPVFLFGTVLQGVSTTDMSGTDTTQASTDTSGMPAFADVIDSDSAAEGALAAQTICEKLDGTGTVLELLNFPAEMATDTTMPAESIMFTVARQRSEGFNSTLTDTCPNLIVQSLDVSTLDKKGIRDAYLAAVKGHDITGVVGYDDQSVISAVEANVIGRIPGVTLLGFDASDSVLGALQSGRLTAAIASDPVTLGEIGVTTVIDFLKGPDVGVSTDPVPLAVLDAETLEAVRGGRKLSGF